jgi:unsaturated rhamnogalacturonyl hydrolase
MTGFFRFHSWKAGCLKSILTAKDAKLAQSSLYHKVLQFKLCVSLRPDLSGLRSSRLRLLSLLRQFLFVFMALNGVSAQQQITYAGKMAESILKSNPGSYGGWDYVTGTVLRGYAELWKITGEKKYYDYIKNTVDRAVKTDGSISSYNLSDYNIDQIREGCAVLFLYRETGLTKYKTAAELLRKQLSEHPRTSEGGFWHKLRYPWQMWLDGLYMGSPFLAEYGSLFSEPEAMDDVMNQLLLAHKHTRDSVTGLYYHGWDEKREQEWADSVTGQSPSFWGRAMGWYAMAIVDALDYIPMDHPERDSVLTIMNRFSLAIKNFQDSVSGVWWQVTDQGDREGNYLESSSSCMFVYALAKAVRKGYIDTSYRPVAEKGFRGILDKFITPNADGTLSLGQTCLTAGLGYGRDGTYNYYVNETSISTNDGKALGPFILAAIEMENPIFPPTELRQDTTFKEGVKLDWKDNSGNETGFLIQKYQNEILLPVVHLAGGTQTYTDTVITAGSNYSYRVIAVNETDTSTPASIQDIINFKNPEASRVERITLPYPSFICFPNPVMDYLTISFTLPQDEFVWILLTDAIGRTERISSGAHFGAGEYCVNFNTGHLSPGIYLCRLTTTRFLSYNYLIIN